MSLPIHCTATPRLLSCSCCSHNLCLLPLFLTYSEITRFICAAPCLQLNLFALLLFLVGLGWLAGVSVWQLVNSQLFVLYYVHYADRSFISRMIIAIFHTGRLMRGFTGKLGGFMQHNFFRPFLKVFGGWEHDYALPVYLPSSDSTHGQENDLSQVLIFSSSGSNVKRNVKTRP